MKYLALFFSLLAFPALAQSTAQQMQPGFLTTSGCPSGALSCFKPYSSASPLPIAVYDAGDHAGFVYTSNGSALPATFQAAGGGGGSPGGSTFAIQYNAGSSTFGGITPLTDGQLVVGQTGAAALGKTLSGDATLAASGAITIANNAVTLAKLATQATNTVLANATSGTAVPTALSVSSCSTAGSALIWTTNTGFGCNTSITAASVAVGGITGLGTGIATWLATPSSANLAAAVTDETGTGALVFAGGPTLTGTTAGANSTWAGTVAVTSASAAAFAVGANGSSNPAFAVDASTGSSIGGVIIKSAVTGGNTSITATDSGSNQSISLVAKGTGSAFVTTSTGNVILNGNSTGSSVQMKPNGTTTAQFNPTSLALTPGVNPAAATVRLGYTPSADTALTASTNAPLVSFLGSAVTRQHSTGTLALQSDYNFDGATDSFVGASTLTTGATVKIGLKGCSTNATCTSTYGLYIPTLALTGTPGTGIAGEFEQPTGATNNFAAQFSGVINLLGTIPVASSCGGGAAATGSTTHKGQITGVSAATGCTITFAAAQPLGGAAPSCQLIGNPTVAAPSISAISTTAVTFAMTAFTGTLYYICF